MLLNSALAMLAGVVSPPIILGGAGGANLLAGDQQYLVSTSLVVCGILSAIQITRFHIWGTPYVLVLHGPGECGMDGALFPLRFLADRQDVHRQLLYRDWPYICVSPVLPNHGCQNRMMLNIVVWEPRSSLYPLLWARWTRCMIMER